MDTRIRVFVSQLPIGITEQEIESVFSKYGEILVLTKLRLCMAKGLILETGLSSLKGLM